MRFVPIGLLLIVLGCTQERQTAPELIGTWENTFMMLESADLPETHPQFDVFVADTNNWLRVTGVKPVRTTFKADGTFEGEHRDKNDSIYTISRGTWHTVGDSLYFFQWEPDTFIITYHFSVARDTVTLQGIVDWDRDGKKNDKYFGTQGKIRTE